MYGKGGAFTLSLIVLQCRKSTDSNDSLYNSWQVLEHNKISDRWTDKGGGGSDQQHTAPLHFNNKRTSIRSKWMYLTLLNSRSPKIFPICHPWSVNYHTNEILMMKILNYTFFSTQQIIH